MIRIIFLSIFINSITTINFAQETPCVNGEAGRYPCSNISLLARLNPTELFSEYDFNYNNDIWGWTDPVNGNEIAIVGRTNGTAFVDISDPENPVHLGLLRGHNNSTSSWRDIKVYNDHAFIAWVMTGIILQYVSVVSCLLIGPVKNKEPIGITYCHS